MDTFLAMPWRYLVLAATIFAVCPSYAQDAVNVQPDTTEKKNNVEKPKPLTPDEWKIVCQKARTDAASNNSSTPDITSLLFVCLDNEHYQPLPGIIVKKEPDSDSNMFSLEAAESFLEQMIRDGEFDKWARPAS